MFVILETLWTRIKSNFEKGIRTWIYVDEIYLMFANDYCVNFFYTLWKRARKYGAILTGITQNVEDLLHNEKIGTLLSNSNYIVMLNQSSQDRDNLADLLNLSPQMLSSITNCYNVVQQLFLLEITFQKITIFTRCLLQTLMKS